MRKENKLIALGLSMMLAFSAQAVCVFAEGEPEEPPATPPAAEEPAEVHQLTGKIYENEYGKGTSGKKPASGKVITITLGDGSEAKVTAGSDGSFTLVLQPGQEKESGEYSWSFDKNENYLGASGTIGYESADLLINERYKPASSDYSFADSEDIIDGVLRKSGKYTIVPAEGKKLALTLDGTPESSITVNVADDGTLDDFYVITDGSCSKVLSGEKAKIDDGAPVISSVTAAAGDDKTFVRGHGIYSSKEAVLELKASIKENGAGIDKVWLTGRKDGKEVRYDPASSSAGEYTFRIALPDGEKVLDSEKLTLTAADRFGNKSEEVLIAKTEDGSSVTIESEPPKVEKILIDGKEITDKDALAKKWYTSLPKIEVMLRDGISGLESASLTEDGQSLVNEKWDSREKESQTVEIKPLDIESKDGTHVFEVEVKDNAGNKIGGSFRFKIDTAAPVLSVSGIDSGESYNTVPTLTIKEDERYADDPGNVISVSITRAGSKDKDVLTFKATDTAEIKPSQFDKDGIYTVTVNAHDAAGNEAEPVTVKFIKDTKIPDIAITHTGKANKYGWLRVLPSVSTTAQDGMSGLASFTLEQDGNKVKESTFSKRVTEKQGLSAKADLSRLSDDGRYTFTVKAKDRAGNTAKKNLVLRIDLTAPVISAEGVKSGEHYISVPTINISENEKYYKANGAFLRYRIFREDGKEIASSVAHSSNSMSIPGSLFRSDGVYTVRIDAADAAGNKSNVITYKFVKDSTAPRVSWSGAENGRYYNTSRDITLNVVERWFATDNVSVSATRELAGNRVNVGFPWSNTAMSSNSTRNFSETGTYSLSASARDKAGNSSSTETLSFTIDTKAPEITITGVKDGGVYTYGQGVAPKVEFSDDYPDSQSVSYTKAGVPISNPDFSQTKENDGLYTLTATATDKAGNTTTKVVHFVLNRFGSYFEYDSAIKEANGNAFQNIDQDMVIIERNVTKLTESDKKVYRDGKAIDNTAETKESEMESGYNVYRHIFGKDNFAEEGAYEINVASRDESGNEMESKDENGTVKFYVDRTPPTVTIEGIDPKGIKAEKADLTIRADDLLTGVSEVRATVDGSTVPVTEENGNYTFSVGKGMKQKLVVTATDKAGNTATCEDTVSVSPSSVSLLLGRIGKWLGLGAAAAVAGGGGALLMKKRRNDDDEEEEPEEGEE